MSQPPGPPSRPGEPQGTPEPEAGPAASTPPTSDGTRPPGGNDLPQPPAGAPAPPTPGAPEVTGVPPTSDPGFGYQPPAAPRRRAVLITSIVLGVVLVLCGAGGTSAYFLVKKVGGSGKATPTAAVDGFLTAVFTNHDVDEANRFVCAAARDKTKLTKKIDELWSYEQKYKAPKYSWPEPKVDSRKNDTAIVNVPVTVTTGDDRVAERQLRFVTVNDSGWWVCEVGEAR
jgi:hypothetical protein